MEEQEKTILFKDVGLLLVPNKLRGLPMKKLISLTIASLFLFGCATTVIKTKPSGAKVYMDGKLLGETPCTYSNAGAVGSSKIVTLKMEGYKDNVGQIKKDHPSWPKIIAGAVVAWPLLIWAADFPPEYTFEMEKLESKLSDFPTKPQVTPPEKPITSAPVTPSLGTEKIVTWTFANMRSGAGDN